MADIMITEAPAVVDGTRGAGTTGGAQGAQTPTLSKLYDQLPEAARKQIKAERFAPLAKLDNLVAEIVRLDGEVGNGIRVPKKDAPKEEWAKYRKELGVPDSAEGYALQRPTLPSGLTYNERLEKWFRQELFDAGVPNEAAQRIFNDWNNLQVESYSAAMKAREAQAAAFAKTALETLQAEYKDAYPVKMQSMSAAMARYMTPALMARIKTARTPEGVTLDNDPEFIKAWVNIGDRMGDDTMVGAAAGAAGAHEPRPGLPKTPGGLIADFHPEMERDPRFRVKAE